MNDSPICSSTNNWWKPANHPLLTLKTCTNFLKTMHKNGRSKYKIQNVHQQRAQQTLLVNIQLTSNYLRHHLRSSYFTLILHSGCQEVFVLPNSWDLHAVSHSLLPIEHPLAIQQFKKHSCHQFPFIMVNQGMHQQHDTKMLSKAFAKSFDPGNVDWSRH